MSIDNNGRILSDIDEDVEDHILNHLTLSHGFYSNSKNGSKSARVDRISNISNLRKRTFGVFLPRKLSKHTEGELKLMLISLKNAQRASTVHIGRIERELTKRGCSLSILR